MEETCTGVGAACPGDARRPLGFICKAGETCQPQAICDGFDTLCNVTYLPATTVCRASSDTCDIAEYPTLLFY